MLFSRNQILASLVFLHATHAINLHLTKKSIVKSGLRLQYLDLQKFEND